MIPTARIRRLIACPLIIGFKLDFNLDACWLLPTLADPIIQKTRNLQGNQPIKEDEL